MKMGNTTNFGCFEMCPCDRLGLSFVVIGLFMLKNKLITEKYLLFHSTPTGLLPKEPFRITKVRTKAKLTYSWNLDILFYFHHNL